MKTGQRHSKKDYEKLKTMEIADVLSMSKEQKRVKKFEEDQEAAAAIVKVEKKKNFKRRPKSEQAQKDAEIQKLLQDSPQDINYEKAMELYE